MPGPLSGVRILDLSAMISGPLAGQILGDQGADVIKIEPLGSGDIMRQLGPQRNGISSFFAITNRSKRSIAIDLKSKSGIEIFLKLAKSSDVIIQNFRPGAVERMGIDYERISSDNKDIIYASISGFGPNGPYSKQRVYDPVIQAISGFADTQKDLDTGKPTMMKTLACDKATAMTVAQAITAALFARSNGKGGQHIEINMLDSSIAFLWPDSMYNHTFQETFDRVADVGDFNSIIETKDGYFTFAVVSDAEFFALYRALGLEYVLDNPEYTTAAGRMKNAVKLVELALEAAAKMTTDEVIQRMREEDASGGPINTRKELHKDPQVIHNGSIIETFHPIAGKMHEPKPAANFKKTPASISNPAPELGQHTQEILVGIGYSEKQINDMHDQGIID